MLTAIVCRNCGHADLAEIAENLQDALTVGMYERQCPACNRGTRWGRGLELRRRERRLRERRIRAQTVLLKLDRRAADRRGLRRRHPGIG